MKTREDIMRMVYSLPPHFKLWPIEELTSAITCGVGNRYRCELHGPFYDVSSVDPGDHRIFVVYRYLRGHESLQILVQDADDDTFLNSNAWGAERYNVGPLDLGQLKGPDDWAKIVGSA